MAAEAALAAAQQQHQTQQQNQQQTRRTANLQVELQAIEDYRRFAALTIQRYTRGWLVRLRRARRVSARVFSSAVEPCKVPWTPVARPCNACNKVSDITVHLQEAAQRQQQQSAAAQHAEAARLYKAARTIQDIWRSYKNKRVYRFYRDLIRFRSAHSLLPRVSNNTCSAFDAWPLVLKSAAAVPHACTGSLPTLGSCCVTSAQLRQHWWTRQRVCMYVSALAAAPSRPFCCTRSSRTGQSQVWCDRSMKLVHRCSQE